VASKLPTPSITPLGAFPALSSIQTIDLVGPLAANRQPDALLADLETMRATVNTLAVDMNAVAGKAADSSSIISDGLDTYLARDGVDPMQGTLNMNSHIVSNVAGGAAASGGTDATTTGALWDHLPRDGTRAMTGVLNMGGHEVSAVGETVITSGGADAATTNQVWLQLPRDGTRDMTGALHMGAGTGDLHQINFLADGTADNDAVAMRQLPRIHSVGTVISGSGVQPSDGGPGVEVPLKFDPRLVIIRVTDSYNTAGKPVIDPRLSIILHWEHGANDPLTSTGLADIPGDEVVWDSSINPNHAGGNMPWPRKLVAPLNPGFTDSTAPASLADAAVRALLGHMAQPGPTGGFGVYPIGQTVDGSDDPVYLGVNVGPRTDGSGLPAIFLQLFAVDISAGGEYWGLGSIGYVQVMVFYAAYAPNDVP